MKTVGRVRYGGRPHGDNSRCGPTAASTATLCPLPLCREMDGPLLYHHPPAAPACEDLIEAIPEEDWTPIPYWMDGSRRCRRDDLHPVPDQAGRRAGAAHCRRCWVNADARFPARPLRQIQLSRLHHRPRWGDAGTGGRSSPPRPRIENAIQRPQVRRRAEPHAGRRASTCQRRLAERAR